MTITRSKCRKKSYSVLGPGEHRRGAVKHTQRSRMNTKFDETDGGYCGQRGTEKTNKDRDESEEKPSKRSSIAGSGLRGDEVGDDKLERRGSRELTRRPGNNVSGIAFPDSAAKMSISAEVPDLRGLFEVGSYRIASVICMYWPHPAQK